MVRKNEDIVQVKSNTSSPSKKDIQVAAYYNWIKRGKPLWNPQTDWIAAEKQIHS
jgi:hypothetical protein